MSVDDGAEQLPGAAAPVHAHHAQYLKEAQPAQRRGGKHLAAAAQRDHHEARHDRHDIYQQEQTTIQKCYPSTRAI